MLFKKNRRSIQALFVVTLGVFGSFLPLHPAHAATLSLFPAAPTVTAGNIITLNVVVDAQGQAINSSDAIIEFPTDLLNVVSVSKSSSIFTLWVEDPTFSNTTGQISFNGGLINPGYSGSNGELVSITFQAEKAGTASILFSDSSVRANDGEGTDVLTAKNGATLTIISPKPAPVQPIAKPSTKVPPSAPAVATTTNTNVSTSTAESGVSAINLTSYPSNITVGQTITLTGHASYANAPISISLVINGNTVTRHIEADTNGVFSFESDIISNPGIATVWADLLDQNGNVIASTDKVSITVEQPALIRIGTYSVQVLTVLIPLGVLLFTLIFLLYLGWHEFFRSRTRLKKDLDQTKARIHQAFKTLSEEASDQLAILEKSAKQRKLSPTEEKAIEDLHTAIDTVDTYITNIIEKIEKADL